MIRARIFAIACGYEDCNDFETLRSDPVFKLACGRRPDSDPDLASQPTLSRLENASGIRDAIRLTYALIDQSMASLPRRLRASRSTSTTPATRSTAANSCRCSTPITTPTASCRSRLRHHDGPARGDRAQARKTPSRKEVRCHIRRLVRQSWPSTRIMLRGDSHYARPDGSQ